MVAASTPRDIFITIHPAWFFCIPLCIVSGDDGNCIAIDRTALPPLLTTITHYISNYKVAETGLTLMRQRNTHLVLEKDNSQSLSKTVQNLIDNVQLCGNTY